ncbi:exosome complex component RRP43 [Octopus bimaculoides]|uniref:Ribosomal RNA-processing protein 43 n=1 Tax=Octopus bimaculoides TaxID=37653 RepID=A0A0L8I2M4_OCTBM|nr:exosome complex component RRP43 [Octopus bimaculoides]|eukprot:XP_014791363.1 PREDICTED: exosome complex component RRP43-like [Octopus bimaculoides]
MAEDFEATQPLEYLRKFLKNDVRPDGRELGESRSIIVNIGYISSADGSALVKTGDTAVICGIKVELAIPKCEEPDQGFIVPNLELSTLCSPNFRPGPPGDQAQRTSQMLFDIVKNSKCLDLKELCITPGKLVWVLYCDMICLDYDGNVLDVALLSLMAALYNCQLPKVTVDEDSLEISVDFDSRQPLNIHSHPVATTFSLMDGNILLMDPCIGEENLSDGTITICTCDQKLCGVFKPGGAKISDEKLFQCISRAEEQGAKVQCLLQKALKSKTDNKTE